MKKVLVSFLLALSTLSAYPTWNFTVKNFYKTESQSGTQNWCVKQQHNNWMYFANSYGLLEFDGSHWAVYPVTNHSNVRAIEIDAKGIIYAGAYNEFGYYSPDKTAHLIYHSLSAELPSRLMSFGNVWQIHAIDEQVYYQTDYGIFKYKNGTTPRFIDSKRKIDYSTCIRGTIYVTSDEGVFILNGENFFPLPNTQVLAGTKVCGIIPDGSSGLIIATANAGLFRYADRQISPWKTQADPFVKNNTLFCITGNDKNIALGSIQHGTVILNRSGQVTQYINNLSGLQNNTVLNLTFDKNGDLWLALDNGISVVAISSPFSHLYGEINSYGSGYVSLVKAGKLYLGTNQGLYCTSWPVAYSESLLRLNAVEGVHGQVWTVNDIDGTLFCGTDAGAFLIDGNRATRISTAPGFWLFQKWNAKENVILAGSYRGFWALRRAGKSWLVNKIKGFDESARLFEQDNAGNVWMSHGLKGVYCLRFDKELTRVESVNFYGKKEGFPDNLSISVFKIKDQILFTTTKGIYSYNPQNKLMQSNASLNAKLDGDVLYAKVVTNREHPDELWYIVNRNLVISNLKTKQKEQYPLDNEMIYGFESLNIIDNSTAILGDENGFNLFRRLKNSMNKSFFMPSVRRVYITNPKDSLVYGQSYPDASEGKLAINYSYNSLRIECNTNQFQSGKRLRFFYKLDKTDADWALFPTSGSKEYTNLHEGNYRFKIKAVDTVTQKTLESEFRFEILPPWYRSVWMYLVYFVLIALAINYSYKRVNRRIVLHRIQIEEETNRQLEEQQTQFKQKTYEKEKEIIQLKADNLQHELKSKTQELANTVMNVVRKNEMLMEISSDLQKVSTAENMEVLTSRLRKLQNRIKNNIEHDDDWKKFEENFDSVHENFLKLLSERYPSLTKSEKKLCAYLRMNLVSKDIAPLLNISVRGVEISRYRLRQKLELPRDVNLTDFLQRL